MNLKKTVLILTLTLTTLSINGVTMADTEYDFLLNSISQDKQVPIPVLEDLMENIAIWESDFNRKEIKPDAVQVGGGPGRGAFQFELMDGGSGRNKSAKTRLNNYYKMLKRERPEWLKNLPDNFDASTLPLEQQKMLFLGDARMGPGNLSKLVAEENPMTVGDWWAERHKIKGVSPEDRIEFNRQAEINRLRRQENRPVNTSTATVLN